MQQLIAECTVELQLHDRFQHFGIDLFGLICQKEWSFQGSVFPCKAGRIVDLEVDRGPIQLR